MNNNKQSSVDYYAFEALRLHVLLENRTISVGEYAVKHHELLEQAKAMHKNEIINAVEGFPIENRGLLGEDYYNETYGGK